MMLGNRTPASTQLISTSLNVSWVLIVNTINISRVNCNIVWMMDVLYIYLPVLCSDVDNWRLKMQIYFTGREIFERPPHIFAIADAAYKSMRRNGKDTCIVISGQHAAAVLFNFDWIIRRRIRGGENRSQQSHHEIHCQSKSKKYQNRF